MLVLKTIPEVPAIAEIIDSVFVVTDMNVDFINKVVTFSVVSSYNQATMPRAQQDLQVPMTRMVSFDEIGAKVTNTDVLGFIAVARNAVAISMGVTLDKVPENIFS